MAIALIDTLRCPRDGVNSNVSPSFDSAGATFIAVIVGSDQPPTSCTDNKGNTFTRTVTRDYGDRCATIYTAPVTTAGSGHVVTVNALYASCVICWFSGDVETPTGGTASNSEFNQATINTGSVTPDSGALVLAAASGQPNAQETVGGDFSIADYQAMNSWARPITAAYKIADATASTSATFSGSVDSRASSICWFAEGAGLTPINTVPPALSGTETVGETLTSTTGTWDSQGNGTITYAYQWTRSNDGSGTGEADISGATSSTYTLTASDEGKYIRCRVRASNDGGYDAAEDTESGFTGAIAAGGSGTTYDLGNVDTVITVTTAAGAVSVLAELQNVDTAADTTSANDAITATLSIGETGTSCDVESHTGAVSATFALASDDTAVTVTSEASDVTTSQSIDLGNVDTTAATRSGAEAVTITAGIGNVGTTIATESSSATLPITAGLSSVDTAINVTSMAEMVSAILQAGNTDTAVDCVSPASDVTVDRADGDSLIPQYYFHLLA